MGNLGKDPELRYMPNQTPVSSISLAYTENGVIKPVTSNVNESNGLMLCCTANRQKQFVAT